MIWRTVLTIGAFFLLSVPAVAQPFVSKYGKFEVSAISGCAPLSVSVTVRPPFSCGACDIDLFGNNQFQSLNQSTPYVYPNAGSFWMRVLIGTSPVDSVLITVVPDTPPVFEVYLCGNNEVSVSISDTNFAEYVINYNDGSPVVVVPRGPLARDNHVYATSGVKTVSVRGRNTNASDNCTPATRSITTQTTLQLGSISLLTVTDPTSISLDFNTQPDVLHRLEIATNNGTTFQFLKNIYNVTSDVITNLKPDDFYYCFRLGTVDPCTNSTTYSPVICSANLDLAIQNNLNAVSWVTRTTGISSFRITRTASDGTTFSTSPTASPYNDSGITCGLEYCYQLVTHYPNGSQSISLEKCGTAISDITPFPVEDITAVVGPDALQLTWEPVAGFNAQEYTVFRNSGGSGVLVENTSSLQIIDPAYQTETPACYTVRYEDVCGNVSPTSAEACPIRLVGSLRKDNAIQLNWTAYVGWKQGVASYRVEKFTEQGVLLQTFPAGTSISYLDDSEDLDNQAYRYIVRAVPVDNSLPQAVSNPVIVIKEPNLFYPRAFTPNQDNLNDNFTVFGHYVVGFEMSIFNRWGELMFSTDNLEDGWDGTYLGSPMPEGTYTFIAHITDLAGRTFKRSGSVLLLRKGN